MLRIFKSAIPCIQKAKDIYRLEEMEKVSPIDEEEGSILKNHNVYTTVNGKMRVTLLKNGIDVRTDSQEFFLAQFKSGVFLWINSLNQLISVSVRDVKIWQLKDNQFECTMHSSWYPLYELGGVSLAKISLDKRMLLIQYHEKFILFDLVAKKWTYHAEAAIEVRNFCAHNLYHSSAVSSSKFATYERNNIKIYHAVEDSFHGLV